MRYERILELEDKEFTDKLFKNAVFKGGGSAPAPAPAQTTTIQQSDPWVGQQDYLKDIFAKAQSQYNSATPLYFPSDTLADVDPLQTQAQNNIVDYIQGDRLANIEGLAEGGYGELLGDNPTINSARNLTGYGDIGIQSSLANSLAPVNVSGAGANVSPALTQMLSGDPTTNPYFQATVDATGDLMDRQFFERVMPQARSSLISFQPGGSTRGDIVQGQALGDHMASRNAMIADLQNTEFQRAMQQQGQGVGLYSQLKGIEEAGRSARAGEGIDQLSKTYVQALDAEQRRNQALGLGLQNYSGIASQPLADQNVLSSIGAERRGFGQQDIEQAIARHNFEQNLASAKLAQYHNLISGNLGMSGSSTATNTGLGGGGGGGFNLMGGLGGALGGYGLASSIGALNPYTAPIAVAGGLLGAFG